jgi:cell division protein FtsZ
MSSPLLESARIDGAKGCVINVSGGKDMTLEDMTTAAEVIYDMVDPDANIIIGAVVDDRLEGEIHVTVIATGFESGAPYRSERATPSFATPPAAESPADHRGAKIPPFLLNRQSNLREE